jgi:ATP-dependent Lhr-like helicase
LPEPALLGLSSGAGRVLAILERCGASFFTDVVETSGLLRTQVEAALGELITWGLVSCDTFIGLRALSAPAHKRPSFVPRDRRRRRAAAGVAAAGRWVCFAGGRGQAAESGARRVMTELPILEHIAWVLLQRYGVVFRKLLERESAIPPWRELLYVYHRLEARGEIRGGRFVQQFSGEQFALPEAVGALKAMRQSEGGDALVVVSAADPLNLVGIITPGGRLPAMTGNRVVYRDGVPEALYINGTIRFLHERTPAQHLQLQDRLLRRHSSARVGSSLS